MLGNLTDRLAPDQLRARLDRARHGVHVARVDGADRLVRLGAESLTRAHDLLDVAPASLEGVTRPLQGLVDEGLGQLNTAPIDGYDRMNVKQVDDAVRGLGPLDLARVERHERASKNRKTVLRAVDRERERLREVPETV
jgi:hypothetical protein